MTFLSANRLPSGAIEAETTEGTLIVPPDPDNSTWQALSESGVSIEDYAPSLSDAKSAARSRVAGTHAEFLRSLTGDASAEERDTWQTKALAAAAIRDQSAADYQRAMIETEAELAGESELELVEKILGKAKAYHSLIGLATGMKRRTEAKIEAAKSIEEIETIIESARLTAEAKAAEWLESLAR